MLSRCDRMKLCTWSLNVISKHAVRETDNTHYFGYFGNEMCINDKSILNNHI